MCETAGGGQRRKGGEIGGNRESRTVRKVAEKTKREMKGIVW
jgi:hypothetical protein